jgi:hypothetical protein
MKKEPVVFIYEPRIDYLNLYCLNLLVYVNAQFVVFNRFEEIADEIKKKSPDLILINLLDQDKAQDKLSKLQMIFKDKFSPPLNFITAKTSETYSQLNISDSDLSVKDIISTIAKKLGITAKYMAELDVGEYFPIPLKYILPGWQVTQNFYIKDESGQYKVLLLKDQFFTNEMLQSFSQGSIVYCKSSYRLEVINSFTSNMKAILDREDLSNSVRFNQTEVAFEMISQSVASIGLPDTTMQLARSSIKSMEKLVANVPSLSKLYQFLLEDSSSIRFKHSMLSSYIGQFVLKDQSWNNPNITQQWSYLCFFHDIVLDKDSYLLFEYDEDVKKSKLSDKEKAVVLNHAQMAAKIISQMKDIPIGIDTLLKQHHGSKMGNSLSEISMTVSPMCIIFILVENYVHFLLSNGENKKSPSDIVGFIDSLFKKYPYPNYKKMIPLLRTIPLKD